MTAPAAEPYPQARTVSLAEAARRLDVSRSHAYELARRGEFPCRVIRLGRRVVVPRADLARLLGEDVSMAEVTVRPQAEVTVRPQEERPMDATTARSGSTLVHDCPRCGGSGTDLDADDWGPAVPCAGCGGAGWVDAAGLARIAELRAWQDERQDAAAVVGRRTPAPTAAD